MKALLFISWLLMGGAGYFGYNFFQKSLADAQRSAESLNAANASNADLTAKVAALSQQVSTLQDRMADARARADAPSVPVTAMPVSVPEIPTTITTLTGKTYTGCVLSRTTPDGISFTHSTGVAKVLFTELDRSFAAKFGYDPSVARVYQQQEATRDAQSDAHRSLVENTRPAPTADGTTPAPTAEATQAAAQAARGAQIASLEAQITQLQSEAQRLDEEDKANFNSIGNIYYNETGQVEHHSTMAHNPKVGDDRIQIASLQGQIAVLQASQ